jgi:Kdo2-lipid IVA lauroyltransferase/acyltransferase
MDLILTIFFLIGIVIVGILPFTFLYGFADIVGFLIYRIFGYRMLVIRKNLDNAFPGLPENDLRRIIRLIYKNLADIFIEGIRAFTMTRKQVFRRHRIINMEILQTFALSGRSFIAVTGHYTNWEWGTMSANAIPGYKVVAFYKRINNKYIDKLIRWNRSKFGTTLVSINETSLTFEKLKDQKTIFLMASDQGMPKQFYEKAYWVRFLNQDTPFLHGMEKHARLNDLPVIYVDVQRIKRGYYSVELSVLTTKPNELESGVLTEKYARKLESIIQKKPENWLWSHNRWKLPL